MPPRKLRAVHGSQRSAPRATIAATIARGDEIFRLIASGYTIAEASQALEPPMTPKQASKLFNDALERVAQSDTSLRQAMLERELETLRLLKKKWMPLALDGEADAANIILKVIDRVANLAGLNQSLKVQISNQRVDATVSELVDLLESGAEDQVPRLLERGVLVIEGSVQDETAAG